MFDGLFLDPFSAFDDCLCPPEVGVCGCDVSKGFMISVMVVMFDEGFDLTLQITGQEVVFQQDPVLQLSLIHI